MTNITTMGRYNYSLEERFSDELIEGLEDKDSTGIESLISEKFKEIPTNDLMFNVFANFDYERVDFYDFSKIVDLFKDKYGLSKEMIKLESENALSTSLNYLVESYPDSIDEVIERIAILNTYGSFPKILRRNKEMYSDLNETLTKEVESTDCNIDFINSIFELGEYSLKERSNIVNKAYMNSNEDEDLFEQLTELGLDQYLY